MTGIIQPKLIDRLVQQRNTFIEVYLQAIRLHQESIKVADAIDNTIPTQNSGYIDHFGSVFRSVAVELGQVSANSSMPREYFIQSVSESKLRTIITKHVDSKMWKMLFNRLGLLKSMSQAQQNQFFSDCDNRPKTFSLDNVQATLQSLHDNRDSDLLDSLFDVFLGLSSAYASNGKRQIRSKVIIENAFHEYGDTFKLTNHEHLDVLLNVIWRWVLMNNWRFDNNGMSENAIWTEVSNVMEASNQDYDAIGVIHSHGIEFQCFKKKTIHVVLPDSMVSLLNDQLAKTGALPPI